MRRHATRTHPIRSLLCSSGEVGPLEVEFRDDQNFVRKQLPEEKQKAREAAVEANKAAEEARRAAEASRSVGEEKIASSIAIEWSELELDKQPLGCGSYILPYCKVI